MIIEDGIIYSEEYYVDHNYRYVTYGKGSPFGDYEIALYVAIRRKTDRDYRVDILEYNDTLYVNHMSFKGKNKWKNCCNKLRIDDVIAQQEITIGYVWMNECPPNIRKVIEKNHVRYAWHVYRSKIYYLSEKEIRKAEKHGKTLHRIIC